MALNVDKSNFFPIVGINAVSTAESYQLSLVVTTASGVRLYYTTADNNSSNVRPHNLTLQHVRLPPGFAASSPVGRPSKVHISCYQNGTLLLTLLAKKNVDSLQLQSQLKVLQICHEKCEKLEIEYLNEFCKKLSAQQQRMEMDINLMNADWNQIVDKYEVKNAKKSMKGKN